MSFLANLSKKWKLQSGKQAMAVLLVFCLTGFTVVFIKHFLPSKWLEFWWFDVVYYTAILPVYQALLLAYGAIFGLYRFFVDREKALLKRIMSLFKGKNG